LSNSRYEKKNARKKKKKSCLSAGAGFTVVDIGSFRTTKVNMNMNNRRMAGPSDPDTPPAPVSALPTAKQYTKTKSIHTTHSTAAPQAPSSFEIAGGNTEKEQKKKTLQERTTLSCRRTDRFC
jgi:hypothetical protein